MTLLTFRNISYIPSIYTLCAFSYKSTKTLQTFIITRRTYSNIIFPSTNITFTIIYYQSNVSCITISSAIVTLYARIKNSETIFTLWMTLLTFCPIYKPPLYTSKAICSERLIACQTFVITWRTHCNIILIITIFAD